VAIAGHGLTVLLLGSAYLGWPLAILGVTWFAVGMVLASLLEFSQCAMYVRQARRYGNGVDLLKAFLSKFALMLVLWPLVTAGIAWEMLTAPREVARSSEDDFEDFEDDDQPPQAKGCP
jgi:hypothetical protein